MNEEYAPIAQDDDEGWAIAEQWFMRFIGASLMLIAIASIFVGVFPMDLIAEQFVRGINIITTMVLGIGSLWSLWWSSDIQRIYKLIDGFKENGTGRTYAAAVMQFIFGGLFALELMGGSITLGLSGAVILISAFFFVWRAQQIKRFSY